MPSIGKIIVKREISHKLLPPVSTPIVKGPSFPVQLSLLEQRLIPATLQQGGGPSGGGETSPNKHVSRGLVENVTVGAGVATRTVTPGVTGVSYTQLSFTVTSYTILGLEVTKGLTETVTVGAGTATRQSAKERALAHSEIGVQEITGTVTIERGKTRALSETVEIDELLTKEPETRISKVLNESVTISEDLARLKESKRSQTENVFESGDVEIELPGVRLSVTEDVTISDSVAIEVTHAAGTHVTKSLTEDVTIGESLTKLAAKTRALATETITITEDLQRQITTTLTSYSSDSFTILSYTTIVRNEKTLNENVETSDTVRISLTKNRGITENVEVSDSVERVIAHPTGDPVTVSDQVTRQVGKGRGLSENVDIVG